MDNNLGNMATENCKNILLKNYKLSINNKTILIYDDYSDLSKLLFNSYKLALEELGFDFEYFVFYQKDQEEIKSIIDSLSKNDLVILVQSSSFRMSKYRWRNLLFDQGLKVIEHPHLEKNVGEKQLFTYINSLNYDMNYYFKCVDFLRDKLEKTSNIKIVSSDGSVVEFDSVMDSVYDNMAFFEDKKNWGTRFPVGEVLTEALDLEKLNGEVLLYAFPNTSHETQIVEPFKCIIKNGKLFSHEGPKEFDEIFNMIKLENPEGEVFIRELGFGLNRGIGKFDVLGDVSSYERLVGVHFSLGMKHGIYQKKLYPKYGRKFYQRYHIDVFLDLSEVFIDNIKVYSQGKGWLIAN